MDAATGTVKALLPGDNAGLKYSITSGDRGPAAVQPLSSPRGEQIVSVTPLSTGGWFTLMLIDSKNRVKQRMHHRSAVRAAAFHPRGRYLASATQDGGVHLWDLERRRPVWHSAQPAGAPGVKEPTPRWLHAARGAWQAARSSATACLISFEGGLEAWDTARDRRLLQVRLKVTAAQVLVHGAGCVVRDRRSGVTLHRPNSPPLKLAPPTRCHTKADPPCVSAATVHGDRILLARGSALLEFDTRGAPTGRRTVPPGLYAVARVGKHLVGSNHRGKVLRLPAAGGKEGEPLADVPSSNLEVILDGPAGTSTVALGFTSGQVGLWDLTSGERLVQARLRGPATSLALEGTTLHAASSFGDRRAMDLSPLTVDHCTLLRRARRLAPFVYKELGLRPAPGSTGNICRKR